MHDKYVRVHLRILVMLAKVHGDVIINVVVLDWVGDGYGAESDREKRFAYTA